MVHLNNLLFKSIKALGIKQDPDAAGFSDLVKVIELQLRGLPSGSFQLNAQKMTVAAYQQIRDAGFRELTAAPVFDEIASLLFEEGFDLVFKLFFRHFTLNLMVALRVVSLL